MTPSKDIHEAIHALLSQFGDASYEPGDSIEHSRIVSAIDGVTERNQELHAELNSLTQLVARQHALIVQKNFALRHICRVFDETTVHLGPPRESGIEKGCVGCMAWFGIYSPELFTPPEMPSIVSDGEAK